MFLGTLGPIFSAHLVLLLFPQSVRQVNHYMIMMTKTINNCYSFFNDKTNDV